MGWLADPGSRIASKHMFGLDVDPGQAWATLSAAGMRTDGLVHVGVVRHERGLAWIVDEFRARLNQFSGAQLVVDPRADLASLLADLEEVGVRPIRTSSVDYKDACGEFFAAVMERRLRYMSPQPELDSAVAGARTQRLLDAWKWSARLAR